MAKAKQDRRIVIHRQDPDGCRLHEVTAKHRQYHTDGTGLRRVDCRLIVTRRSTISNNSPPNLTLTVSKMRNGETMNKLSARLARDNLQSPACSNSSEI